ncbi:CDP-diacylglycerol--inositol 3-phosphatidyltransferase-like [Saccoglossus kowalevskii]
MTENIFLFVPNIIGYTRIILNLISFWYMRTDYVTTSRCYTLSIFLDAFDGPAARMMGQETKFGALLDQLIDRTSTMCLMVGLSYFYPKQMFIFQILMTIDIVTHWINWHSPRVRVIYSHKLLDPASNPILHMYFTSRPFVDCMCIGNEIFYISLYLLYFTEGPKIRFLSYSIGLWRLCLYISTPVALVKTGISVAQLLNACQKMATLDIAARM